MAVSCSAVSPANVLSYYHCTSSSFSSSASYSSSHKLKHSALIARVQLTLHVNGSLPSPILTSPTKVDFDVVPRKNTEDLQERTRRTLQRVSDPTAAMKLIDTLQWLGISYHYEEEVDMWLDILQHWDAPRDDLHATALRFRLLRQNARHASPDVFRQFMMKEQDKEGLLSLYEASYLGANGEDSLLEAMKFAEIELKSSMGSTSSRHLSRCISRALELPRHLRMERWESRWYIDEYRKQDTHNALLLEHAVFDYNYVQSIYQNDLAEISRWWNQLGLIKKLGFARDRLIECFLWTVGMLPEPKYSGARIELAKSVALLTVIDDVFDMYGSLHELDLFTHAVRRWDLDAIEELPEYMKICYMALYNTTNEISFKVLKEQGRNILPFLAKVWIDTVNAYMTEAKWFNSGNHVPRVEDYLRNGVTTSGSYMALVHMFFLMGEGLTTQNVNLMAKPYLKLFSNSGMILRLWDDLGTSKEEQDFGDNASIITLLLRDKSIGSEVEAKEHVKGRIRNLWKDLNSELLGSNAMPLPVIKACLNMSRTSQVVYQHKEDSYFSSVKKFVNFILFEPIDN